MDVDVFSILPCFLTGLSVFSERFNLMQDRLLIDQSNVSTTIQPSLSLRLFGKQTRTGMPSHPDIHKHL
jgi:hypothetical protein